MIKPIKVGDSFSDGCVDRVINIFWGVRRALHTVDCIEYECLFRVNGTWYLSEQCDGQNGGEMTTQLSGIDDAAAEAYAEERKAKRGTGQKR